MSYAKRPEHRRSRVSIEMLEGRELLSNGVGFSDRSVRTVSDTVGKVTVNLVALPPAPNMARMPVTVEVSTEGGNAIAGVDYTPVKQSISFAADETTKSFEVPILKANPSIGTRVLRINIAPTPDNPAGATEFVVIQHGADTTPPQIISAKALTKGGKVVAFSVTFNEDMNIDTVQNVANYAIGDPSSIKAGRSRSWYGLSRAIVLKSATYDPATRTVMLVPAGKVKSFPSFTIADPTAFSVMQAITTAVLTKRAPMITETSISALTDRAGNPITSPSSYDTEPGPNGTFTISASAAKMGQAMGNTLNAVGKPKGPRPR